jgi:hypothetical protein
MKRSVSFCPVLDFQCPRRAENLKINASNSAVKLNGFCSIQQFAAAGVPLPVGGQYLLVQPGANPVLYVTRSDSDNKPDGGAQGSIGGQFIEFVSSNIPGFGGLPSAPSLPFGPTTGVSCAANSTDEKPTEKPSTDQAEKVRAPRFIVYRNKQYNGITNETKCEKLQFL